MDGKIMNGARRMLFIDARTCVRVSRDGPALRVRCWRAADRLYPFERLSSIWINGQVEWQSAALIGCAEYGVPVNFFDRRGQCRAVLSSGPGGQETFAGLDWLFSGWLSHVEGIADWRQWFDVSLYNAAQGSARSLDLVFGSVSECHRRIRSTMMKWVRCTDLGEFDAKLYAYLESWAAWQWRKLGVEVTAPYWRLGGIRPCQDIAFLILWRLQPQIVRFLHRLHKRRCPPGGRKIHLTRADASDFFARQESKAHECCCQDMRNLQGIALQALYGIHGRTEWREVNDFSVEKADKPADSPETQDTVS